MAASQQMVHRITLVTVVLIGGVSSLSRLDVEGADGIDASDLWKVKSWSRPSQFSNITFVNATAPRQMPVNSAGSHTGTRQVVDIVLLFVALLVPFIIWLCIAVWEARTTDCAAVDESNVPLKVVRTGSSYNMDQSINTGISLTAPFQTSENLQALEEANNKDGSVLQNFFAGFATAMAALPDAISFSFITGVSPLNGIWAGVFMGLSAALVGGRPGMISSASAATAVVLAEISTDAEFGTGPMALCVLIVGVLQIIAGALRLSRFITLIPHPVMLGFVNGLAIVMIRAQMRQFRIDGDKEWVDGHIILSMTITGLVAMAASWTWARIPVAGKIFPAPLASLIITVIFSVIFKHVLEPRTLKDVAGADTFRGGWSTMPSWNFPPAKVDWNSSHMWMKVIWTSVRFAVIGLLESLMTEALIDQITKTSGSMRRECFGQGVGNLISGLFGTQGGCALIAQSLLNVSSGGRTRFSGVTMAFVLFLSVVALAPLMGMIPVAALVGLIVLIALNTFAWGSLQLILRINWIDAIVVVITTVVTVLADLATAVVIGLVINALGFAWTAATDVQVVALVNEPDQLTIKVQGPLFFGSAMNYQTEVSKLAIKEERVLLDFSESSILDISATEAISKVQELLRGQGKTVTVLGVSKEVLVEVDPSNIDDSKGVAPPNEAIKSSGKN